MMEGTQSVERVEGLIGTMDTITDTVPEAILDGVTKFYERHGYKLQSFTLMTSGTYDAMIAKKERSA